MPLASLTLRTATQNDLSAIAALLKEFDLPSDGCQQHIENFIVAECDNQLAGVGGLELYKEVSLLRSVAVAHKHRGQSLGNTLFLKLKATALHNDVRELYLLTETAENYFAALGFDSVARYAVPAAIQNTEQFSSLCPDSATVMRLKIT